MKNLTKVGKHNLRVYYDFLKTLGVYDEWQRNYQRQTRNLNHTPGWTAKHEAGELAKALNNPQLGYRFSTITANSFYWPDTPEGDEHWGRVNYYEKQFCADKWYTKTY